MEAWILVGLGVLLVVALGLWWIGSRVPRGSRWSLYRADPAEFVAARERLRTDPTYTLDAALWELLRARRKLWAVRLAREELDVGLAEAKQRVEALERGEQRYHTT